VGHPVYICVCVCVCARARARAEVYNQIYGAILRFQTKNDIATFRNITT